MDIYQLIDSLEELLENGTPIPLSGKRIISVGDAIEIIRQMRLSIPEEIKEAAKLNAECESIIKRAEVESQRLLKDAEAKYSEMVDNHEIISAAYRQANEIVATAQQSAREVKMGAYDYTSQLLEKIEQFIFETERTLDSNRREIESFREQ